MDPACETAVRPHQWLASSSRSLTTYLRVISIAGAGHLLVLSPHVVIQTCGHLVAAGRLCSRIHDAGPPTESFVHGVGTFAGVACSWLWYIRGSRMFVVRMFVVVVVCSWS